MAVGKVTRKCQDFTSATYIPTSIHVLSTFMQEILQRKGGDLQCEHFQAKESRSTSLINTLSASADTLALHIFCPRDVILVWGTREKTSLSPYKRTAFFGPSYFEAALR